MAYKIKEGEVAYVKITDEPVFVLQVTDELIQVNRVMRTNGTAVEYGMDSFRPSELQSEKERLVKELDFTKFSLSMREKYSDEYKQSQEAKAPNKKSYSPVDQADGSSLLN